MTKLLRTAIGALALLAAGLAQAQFGPAHGTGPYLVGAVGVNQYDYDCWWWSDCRNNHSTMVKVGGGMRFGIWGLEAWAMDFGRADIDPRPDTLRLQSVGVNGVWYWNFAPSMSGLLRAGVANVRQTRSFDDRHSVLSGTFGLGFVVDVAPQVGIEAAWDVTGGEGNNTGSSTASALSIGVRIKF